jgi:malonate decarboxylase acyl carrier protein
VEQLKFQYKAKRTFNKNAHVGVVGSGDLEILIEPSKSEKAEVHIRTQIEGFGGIWKDIMDRFFLTNDIVAKIEVNDFGATPGVVFLRLAQAMEVLES